MQTFGLFPTAMARACSVTLVRRCCRAGAIMAHQVRLISGIRPPSPDISAALVSSKTKKCSLVLLASPTEPNGNYQESIRSFLFNQTAAEPRSVQQAPSSHGKEVSGSKRPTPLPIDRAFPTKATRGTAPQRRSFVSGDLTSKERGAER